MGQWIGELDGNDETRQPTNWQTYDTSYYYDVIEPTKSRKNKGTETNANLLKSFDVHETL